MFDAASATTLLWLQSIVMLISSTNTWHTASSQCWVNCCIDPCTLILISVFLTKEAECTWHWPEVQVWLMREGIKFLLLVLSDHFYQMKVPQESVMTFLPKASLCTLCKTKSPLKYNGVCNPSSSPLTCFKWCFKKAMHMFWPFCDSVPSSTNHTVCSRYVAEKLSLTE